LIRFSLFLSFLLLTFSSAGATETSYRHLAGEPYWLALGHYRADGLLLKKTRSFIRDKKFFLAVSGREDPEAELIATIHAVDQAESGDVDQHPVCRFPARYRWLSEQLKDETFRNKYQLRLAACEDYHVWRENIKAHSAALIYASTHLNSPSSMYGHTLLRIDPPDYNETNTAFLSWGVSFGANIPPSDNSILYAYKGIFGGYPGMFNVIPYYEKLKEYSRIENRDVWEYELNLTPAEMDILVVHLWELKEITFDYFFFDENCSYRLLELLDMARPGQKVLEGYPLVAIPVDTVRGVIGAGFVAKVDYQPSVSTKLKVKIDSLLLEEQKVAIDLSENLSVLKDSSYINLPPERQAPISQTAYDYLRYRERKSARNETVAKNAYQLLTEINRLPMITFPDPVVPVQPELGHESGAFTVTAGREAGQGYADMELRLSFHELEDNLEGYMPGSAINMGRFKFRQYESESLQLQQLDVIDIDSLSPRDDFFKPISWRSSVGFERYRTAEKDQGVMQVNGGGGVTYEVWDDTLIYALGTARAEYNEGFDENWQAAVGGASGLLYFSPVGTVHIGVDAYEFFNGYQRSKTFFTYHWDLAKDSAINLTASHHHYDDIAFDRVELSWRQYFR